MASSWLDSWGQSWGDAWGPQVQVPGAMRGTAHGSSTALGILTLSNLEQPAGGGGAGKRPRKLIKPVWYDPGPLIEPRRAPREEAEALLLCDAI